MDKKEKKLYSKVDTAMDFVGREKEVIDFWKKENVFRDSVTEREGVYAGGDAVTGAATVILAMGAGKTAAEAIDEYISSKQ